MSKYFIASVITIATALACYSQENIDLGEIVVTPYYGEEESKSIYTVPYSIKKITKKEIENKNVTNILELLKNTSFINISDWYGTGIKANVDLMGFGDNALSNILVLVNGRRVNDIDLSGIDWTQIPLDNIEEIEIIKGGGVALYGDNSCGGIINIITCKPQNLPFRFEIKSEGGSYSYNKEAIYLSTTSKRLSFSSYTEYSSTNGYRRNSHYRSRYANINLYGKIDNATSLNLEMGHHHYYYGLPGAIYESDLSSGYTRRDSKYPNDNSHMEDNYLAISLAHKISPSKKLIMDISYRNKNGVDNWLSYGGWDSIVDKHLTNINITNRLFLKFDTLKVTHNLIGGIEIFRGDFSADTDDLSIFNSDNYTDIDRKYCAFFINNNISLTKRLLLNLGFRTQKEKFNFDYYSTSLLVDDKISFNEESYEAGLNYQFNNKSNFFLNFSRGFRIPKTDEYFSSFASPPVNKNLKPQISKTIVTGININPTENITANIDFFLMNATNELYYDPLTFSNANYKKTAHKGLNLNIKLALSSSTELSLGYRATEARFKKGPYNNKEIPAVPHSKLNISFNHKFPKGISINIDTVYRSKTYLINDLNNSLDKLNSFWVTNVGLQYKKKNFEFYVSIRNIFNEQYNEYAATDSTATKKALYPSPERNYLWGIRIKF